jgi:hypothetical protein
LRSDHLAFGLSFKLSISDRKNCAIFFEEFAIHVSNILSMHYAILTFASSSILIGTTFCNGFFCVLYQQRKQRPCRRVAAQGNYFEGDNLDL